MKEMNCSIYYYPILFYICFFSFFMILIYVLSLSNFIHKGKSVSSHSSCTISYSKLFLFKWYSSRLNVRRNELCKKVWDGICVPGSRLHHLVPPKRADCHAYELRNKNHASLFKCRTERFKKSFFPTMASNAQSL